MIDCEAILEQIKNTSAEEMQRIVDKVMQSSEPCDPETCQGQCQGMGDCQLCIDFREKTGIVLPSLIEKPY